VGKYPNSYRDHKSITLFRKACYWSLYWGSLTKSAVFQHIYLRFNVQVYRMASFSYKNRTYISLISQLIQALSVPTTCAVNIFWTALKLPLYFYTNLSKQDAYTNSLLWHMWYSWIIEIYCTVTLFKWIYVHLNINVENEQWSDQSDRNCRL